jgi:hypothetical protein
VAINNVSVSTEYVTKLRQELDNYTGVCDGATTRGGGRQEEMGWFCTPFLRAGSVWWRLLIAAMSEPAVSATPASHAVEYHNVSSLLCWLAGIPRHVACCTNPCPTTLP